MPERAGTIEAKEAGSWLRELPVAAVILDGNGVVRQWNTGAAALLGWYAAATPPRLGGPGVPWFDALRERCAVNTHGRVIIPRRCGDSRTALELHARVLDDGRLFVIVHDLQRVLLERQARRQGERRMRLAEAGMRASHERIRMITEVVQDHAVLTLDAQGRIVSWNSGAQRITLHHADSVLHRPLDVLCASGSCVAPLVQRARDEGRCVEELSLVRADGEPFVALVTLAAQRSESGRLRGYVVVMRDLTEQRRAEADLRRSEEQLRHSQKMDAIGRLAAGIAHDFNNVLTAIHGHVNFLLDDLPLDLPVREDAEEIRQATERATALTRQLLTFARRQVISPVPLDVNGVVSGVEKLLRRLITAEIRLETRLEAGLPPVFADPGQIEQVLVNLVVNARDAIHGGGVILIGTRALELDATFSTRGLELQPGRYVELTVTDTGAGMSQDVLDQIFEPFFTTKAEGTGLGLPTVYGIVRQSGGQISVHSEAGVGTTLRIFLPVHEAQSAAVEAVDTDAPAAAGTVLLVEDDDAVRSLAARSLAGAGYRVLEARDGAEALDVIARGEPIDIVVSDMNMPRVDGRSLAERLSDVLPGAGLVMISGFPELEAAGLERLPARRRFLEKPFTPAALVRVVGEAKQQ